MKDEDQVRAQLLKDVTHHVMTVKHDKDLYRHLRFAAPGTGVYSFSVVTWPGNLCLTGDMGTYVFTRIEDMFEFFRRPDGPLSINPGYWAEKVQSADKTAGIRVYEPNKFREQIAAWLDAGEASPETREAVAAEILPLAEEGEEAARTAVRDFEDDDGFTFDDFWEANCQVYHPRFLWCLFAIVWAIREWDCWSLGRTLVGSPSQVEVRKAVDRLVGAGGEV